MANARPTAVWTLLSALMLSTFLVVGATQSPASAATEAQLKYARSAFRATNDVREDRDKVRVRQSKCLQKFANRQAAKLADLGELVHQSLGPILKECHLNLTGENLALGYATGGKAVKQGWMKSKPHRANLLERRYRVMAIAARKTPLGWVVVQLFGRKA